MKIGYTSYDDVECRLADATKNNAMPLLLPLLELRNGVVDADAMSVVAQKFQNMAGSCTSVKTYFKVCMMRADAVLAVS